MIEFKQIIARGTRLHEGKDYFTIYDFVKAYEHFSDPEWDGEPIEPDPGIPKPPRGGEDDPEPDEPGAPGISKRIPVANYAQALTPQTAGSAFMDIDSGAIARWRPAS
jgi:type I restriction enzyme R subunit